MFLFICLASGAIWGIIGAYMVTDGDFGRAGLTAAALSPGIGILMGSAAKRFAGLRWFGRGVYTLLALFVATALFSIVIGVAWPAAVGATVQAAPTNPVVRAITMVGFVWLGMTLWGDVLWLWPLSLANHLWLWTWSSKSGSRTLHGLGLRKV